MSTARNLRRCLLTAVLMLMVAGTLQASDVARLGVVSRAPGANDLAALVTASFSGYHTVEMVERAELEKVLKEQALSAGNKANFVQLGRLLRADGLLVLELQTQGTNQALKANLLAVNPGVLLAHRQLGWPITDLDLATEALGRQMVPLFPKLRVLAKDAVPLSILNIRSSLPSPQAAALDQELTTLLLLRLVKQPEVFVLERRRTDLLMVEKELMAGETSVFWNGSYVVEGTVNPDGIKPGVVELLLRLTPPRGSTPVDLREEGKPEQLAGLVDAAAKKLLVQVKAGGNGAPWDAAAEAKRYAEEAQWAMRWRMFDEARAAADAAWMLGKVDADTLDVRMGSRILQANPSAEEPPLLLAREAMEMLRAELPRFRAAAPADARLLERMRGQTLDFVRQILRACYHSPRRSGEWRLDLADFRRLARELRGSMGEWALQDIAYFVDDPDAALEAYRKPLCRASAADIDHFESWTRTYLLDWDRGPSLGLAVRWIVFLGELRDSCNNPPLSAWVAKQWAAVTNRMDYRLQALLDGRATAPEATANLGREICFRGASHAEKLAAYVHWTNAESLRLMRQKVALHPHVHLYLPNGGLCLVFFDGEDRVADYVPRAVEHLKVTIVDPAKPRVEKR